MPKAQKPLDPHQQKIINLISAAHKTLAIARKVRTQERDRRIDIEVDRIKSEAEAAIRDAKVRIAMEIDEEIALHESNLDEALIVGYNSDIPMRRISLDGFGNRYDGQAQQLLAKLRADGRVGTREGYQRNTSENYEPTAVFPKPIDMEGILAESTTIAGASFTLVREPLVLVEADQYGEGEVSVQQVILELDARDPYFKSIAKHARAGSPWIGATTATLYKNPTTGAIIAHESAERGQEIWDHPVARWAKDHPQETERGFNAQLLGDLAPESSVEFADAVKKFSGFEAAVTEEQVRDIGSLADQLGINPADS